MKSGIYAIVNLTNDKMYIGSSRDMFARWSGHRNLLSKNKHYAKKLQKDWNELGHDNFKFEILEDTKYEREYFFLQRREKYYIDKYKVLDFNYGYNTADIPIYN